MNKAQVPELADGGYWYAVEARPEADDAPGWNFGDLPVGACAWYAEIGGVMRCAVRVATPIANLQTADSVTVAVIVGGSSKPHSRIGGL